MKATRKGEIPANIKNLQLEFLPSESLIDNFRISSYYGFMEGGDKNQPTKSEGSNEFRPTEKGVMRRDSSEMDPSRVRSSKMENGRIVYRIGGVEVTKEQFFGK